MTLTELYNLPVGLRNWFVERTIKQKESEREAIEKANQKSLYQDKQFKLLIIQKEFCVMNKPVVIEISKNHLLTESSMSQFARQLKDILRRVLSIEAYSALVREGEEEKVDYIVKGSKQDR